ncbi:MAG: FlgD immunoglobulin-like domain containing protein [Planctomycetota bacterium]
MSANPSFRRVAWSVPFLLLAGVASAQQVQGAPRLPRLVLDHASRVADPKLAGGGAEFAFHLGPASASANAVAEVVRAGIVVDTLWSGTLAGATPVTLTWDGRDADGLRCDTGAYTLRVSAPGLPPLERPLQLVRLGITEIEAQDGPLPGVDEFQMVYFMKDAAYGFYATPAIHEYRNAAPAGELSDLDRDDGEPRGPVAVHLGTASPALEGGDYATAAHNYPLAYLKGARPRLELTFGSGATSARGTGQDVGYPFAGHELRVRCDLGTVDPAAELVTPGGTALVDFTPLPDEVGRHERTLTFRYECRASGGTWEPIPGSETITLRLYTLLGAPLFAAGKTGTEYAGPWVEVAEYFASWKETLGLPAEDALQVTEVFIKGFFGQNGGLPSAIEGCVYDAYPLGGDGGATHYHNFSNGNMRLSRLLNAHALGRFINCSDNMSATTTMLSMLGMPNMRPVRLGSMNLRAIWGIGAPAYTLDLWGGSHGFSYHHIVTDDDALTVSDSCMQLDEDGNSLALPGTPGWNVRRPWLGTNGYRALSATNNVTKSLESLPGLQ